MKRSRLLLLFLRPFRGERDWELVAGDERISLAHAAKDPADLGGPTRRARSSNDGRMIRLDLFRFFAVILLDRFFDDCLPSG